MFASVSFAYPPSHISQHIPLKSTKYNVRPIHLLLSLGPCNLLKASELTEGFTVSRQLTP